MNQTVFEFVGQNDNFKEQLPKKEIYLLKKQPDFDLSIPPTISTKTLQNCEILVLKTRYRCNRGFISMIADALELDFRKALM